MVTSYRPYVRPRGSEPHIDLVDGPEDLVTSNRPDVRPRGSEPHKDLDGDSLEDGLPHTDHMLGPEGQNLI